MCWDQEREEMEVGGGREKRGEEENLCQKKRRVGDYKKEKKGRVDSPIRWKEREGGKATVGIPTAASVLDPLSSWIPPPLPLLLLLPGTTTTESQTISRG